MEERVLAAWPVGSWKMKDELVWCAAAAPRRSLSHWTLPHQLQHQQANSGLLATYTDTSATDILDRLQANNYSSNLIYGVESE